MLPAAGPAFPAKDIGAELKAQTPWGCKVSCLK